MHNKLANTKSYLDRHFLKNAADSFEEKRKKKQQKDNGHKDKRKTRLRMDDNKEEFCKLLLVAIMRNKVIYP